MDAVTTSSGTPGPNTEGTNYGSSAGARARSGVRALKLAQPTTIVARTVLGPRHGVMDGDDLARTKQVVLCRAGAHRPYTGPKYETGVVNIPLDHPVDRYLDVPVP